MKSIVLLVACAVLAGCVGSPVHTSATYSSKQSAIKLNNQRLLALVVGMDRAEVQQIMGAPERSEGYAWGTVWLYRTAFTSGIYGTADADFTPVVIDSTGKLSGWGRNYFVERVRRSQVEIINR